MSTWVRLWFSGFVMVLLGLVLICILQLCQKKISPILCIEGAICNLTRIKPEFRWTNQIRGWNLHRMREGELCSLALVSLAASAPCCREAKQRPVHANIIPAFLLETFKGNVDLHDKTQKRNMRLLWKPIFAKQICLFVFACSLARISVGMHHSVVSCIAILISSYRHANCLSANQTDEVYFVI